MRLRTLVTRRVITGALFMLPRRLGVLSLPLPCQFALNCRCLAPLEIFDNTWNRIGLARLIIVNRSGGNVAMIALPPFWQLVALLATHWVGDFVLQTNFQASNKNKRLDALSLHVATYTATLFVAAVILVRLDVGDHIRGRQRRVALCDGLHHEPHIVQTLGKAGLAPFLCDDWL